MCRLEYKSRFRCCFSWRILCVKMRCSEGAGGRPPQRRPFLPALPPIGRVAALLDFYPYPQILFLYLDGYHAFPEGRTYAEARAAPEVMKLTCVMASGFFCVYKLHSCISIPPSAETSTRYPLSVLCTDSTRSVLRNRIQQHKAVSTTSAAAFMVLLVLFMVRVYYIKYE